MALYRLREGEVWSAKSDRWALIRDFSQFKWEWGSQFREFDKFVGYDVEVASHWIAG
jgi:hypothetical protein